MTYTPEPDSGVSWTAQLAQDEMDYGRMAEITQHYYVGGINPGRPPRRGRRGRGPHHRPARPGTAGRADHDPGRRAAGDARGTTVTLGGATITTDAPWDGTWTALTPPAGPGAGISLTVKAATAAIVKIQSGG